MSTIGQEVGNKTVTHIRKAVMPDGMNIMERVFFAVPYGQDAATDGWKTSKEITEILDGKLKDTQVHPAVSKLHEEGSVIGRPRNGKRPWEYRRAFKTKRKMVPSESKDVRTVHRKRKHVADTPNPVEVIENAMAEIADALTLLKQQQTILNDLQKVLNN